MAATTTEIRPLLTQGGRYSYNNGGAVLNSTADADGITVATEREIMKEFSARAEVTVQLEDGPGVAPPIFAVDLAWAVADGAIRGWPLGALRRELLLILRRVDGDGCRGLRRHHVGARFGGWRALSGRCCRCKYRDRHTRDHRKGRRLRA